MYMYTCMYTTCISRRELHEVFHLSSGVPTRVKFSEPANRTWVWWYTQNLGIYMYMYMYTHLCEKCLYMYVYVYMYVHVHEMYMYYV